MATKEVVQKYQETTHSLTRVHTHICLLVCMSKYPYLEYENTVTHFVIREHIRSQRTFSHVYTYKDTDTDTGTDTDTDTDTHSHMCTHTNSFTRQIPNSRIESNCPAAAA